MLMVECCRSIGLPARFVSGYHLENPAPESYDLHAWAEVYLPGAGWRGFDPSAGGETTDRYIVLASSSRPDLTAAITGSFSGLASTQKPTELDRSKPPLTTSTIQPEKKTHPLFRQLEEAAQHHAALVG